MCGRCRNVFNAFETLKRIGDGGASDTVDYSIVNPRHNDPVVSPDGAAFRDNSNPALINESGDPIGLHDASSTAQLEVITARTDAASTGQVDALHDSAEEPETRGDLENNSPADPPFGRGTDDTDPSGGGGSDNTQDGDTDDPVGVPESNNPLITGPMPPVESANSARGWRWLGVTAGVVLISQATYFFRSEIVQQYPPLRPSFVAACEIAGCAIAFGRDANAIKIESSDLIEPPGKPGRILLTAIIANRANTAHDFPFLEVKLMDANNAVLSSRVLSPGEYLGKKPGRDENIAANAELYVNLNLELAGKAPASGYGLRAFYP